MMSEELFAREKRALREFRRLIPTLQQQARRITGRDNLLVEPGPNNETNGNVIFLRPPIELADKLKHVISLCGARATNGQLMCEACLVQEDLMGGLYHEIAHIYYGSFVPYSANEVDALFEKGIYKYYGEDGIERLVKVLDKQRQKGKLFTWLGQATPGVDRVLALWMLALEDVRVNRASWEQTIGMQAIQFARYNRAIQEGIEVGDGQFMRYRDAAEDMQVAMAFMFAAQEYDLQGFFSDRVLIALKDRSIQRYIRAAMKLKDVEATYNLSLKVVNHLRKMGFYAEPEPEPEQEPEPGDSDEQEDQDDSGDSDSSDDGDSRGDDAAESDDESEDSSDDGESGSDESSGQEDSSDPSGDDGESAGDDSAEGDAEDSDGEPDDDSGAGESGDSDGDGSGDGDRGDSAVGDGSSDDGDDADQQGAPQESDRPDGDADESEGEGGSETSGSDGEADSSSDETDSDGGDQGSGPDDGPVEQDAGDGADPEAAPESSEADGPDDDGDAEAEQGQRERSDATDTSDDEGIAGSTGGRVGESPSGGAEAGENDGADPGQDGGGLETSGAAQSLSERLEQLEKALRAMVGHGAHEDEAGHTMRASTEQEEARDEDAYGSDENHEDDLTKVVNFLRWVDNVSPNLNSPEVLLEKNNYGTTQVVYPDKPSVSRAVNKARIIFSNNRREQRFRNQVSGKIHGATLGRRAPMQDPRMFKKKIVPDKKSWAVLVGCDVSFSTHEGFNDAIGMIREMAVGLGDTMHRSGVDFAIWSHSTSGQNGTISYNQPYRPYWSQAKDFKSPWDKQANARIGAWEPKAGNLDGHTMQFYRKQLERSDATEKLLIYVTDGSMPAANFNEELQVLQSEIEYMKKRRIHVMGVGIKTDSPSRHGLDTVQVDVHSDITKVIDHLTQILKAG